MGNPKKDSKHFVPEYLGAKSRSFGEIKGNKCKILLENIPKSFRLRVNSIRNIKRNAKLAFLFIFTNVYIIMLS